MSTAVEPFAVQPMAGRPRSPFGGLWTDTPDAPAMLETAHAGWPGWLHDVLRSWIADGYAILPAAAEPAACDELASELEAAWHNGHPQQLVVDSTTGRHRALVAGDAKRRTRAVDTHVHFEAARRLLAGERLNTFLMSVFAADPLFFQTLVFEVGSEQGLHQDTAFVVVDRPMEMVGVWIALEDVLPGSGELQYVPGSHRLEDHCFAPGRRHYDSTTDGHDAHVRYYPEMTARCAAAGLATTTFLPRKGDVLVWSADLVHGGSPITDAALTRRSLVAHACPSTADPHFFSYLPGNRGTLTLPGGAARYASQYHILPAQDGCSGTATGES